MEPARNWTALYQLVRDRSRVQQIALDLLQLLHDHRQIRSASSGAANAYDLLAGAAFSLWRAVFLAESTEGWEETLANAEAILEKVIRHNAIGYMDDWSNRRWSFLYYVNNARYRLTEFAEIVPEFRAALDSSRDVGAIDNPVVGAYPSHTFNAHCNALDEAVQALSSKQGPIG